MRGSVSVSSAQTITDGQVTMISRGDLLVHPKIAVRGWTSADVAGTVHRRSGLNVAARWERLGRCRSLSDSGDSD
jgi:hypothetical protein